MASRELRVTLLAQGIPELQQYPKKGGNSGEDLGIAVTGPDAVPPPLALTGCPLAPAAPFVPSSPRWP